MLISIIIPIYNSEKYLEECLDSIKSQLANDYEIILVDDGSSDASVTICNSFAAAERNVRLLHIPNKGVYLARKAGIACAQGDYIVFCDSDDRLFPNTISTIETIALNHEPDIISYRYTMGNQKSLVENYDDSSILPSGIYSGDSLSRIREIICEGTFNSLCTKAIKRNLLEASASFETDIHLIHGEDFHQLLEIIDRVRSVYIINECLYYYRSNPQSASHLYSTDQITSLDRTYSILLQAAHQWGDNYYAKSKRLVMSSIISFAITIIENYPDVSTIKENLSILRKTLGEKISLDDISHSSLKWPYKLALKNLLLKRYSRSILFFDILRVSTKVLTAARQRESS